jgi:metallo-beta-lactamase family protein
MSTHTPKKLKVTFCSGTGSVTGANFLVESFPEEGLPNGIKFAIDCGLEQNEKIADDVNWAPFSYNPAELDLLFITHAHIDHIGRIPKIFFDGFQGRIISTPATKDLARYMLEDTCHILSSHDDATDEIKQMYDVTKLDALFDLWDTIEYHHVMNFDGGFKFSFRDAGHVLGSGMLTVEYGTKKMVFTGDLGNSPSPLLRDTEVVDDADYMLMESVYGDRNHERREERHERLQEVIKTAIRKGGALMIPTFSLERTQELLFEINELVENNKIPRVPIYLDSPLGIRLTKVFRQYSHYFNETAQELIKKGDDVFSFPGLEITLDTNESKEILHDDSPKIVIAGSGMSNGGRILHHEKNYLPRPESTLLLTGFQSLGTLGRQIEDGAVEIKIMGEVVPVRAHIEKISGYSGHKDLDHLVDFVSNTAERVKKVFVCMGETKSSLFLAQRLVDYLGVNAVAPEAGTSVELDF